MYDPIQIPYLLSRSFADGLRYAEETVQVLRPFVICFWEMLPRRDAVETVDNIIAVDGCIDLVVGFDEGSIGFSGMSKTEFHFPLELPHRFMGARMVPGAFHLLTGLPATAAMDTFLPIELVDPGFDRAHFFSLPYEEAKPYFHAYLHRLFQGKKPNLFTGLFDQLYEGIPQTTAELYDRLHFSPRQCQRLFQTHFALTPKMVLSILRFQRCLDILTSGRASPAQALDATNYYDQPHFIRDFKRCLGVTPWELIRIYQT